MKTWHLIRVRSSNRTRTNWHTRSPVDTIHLRDGLEGSRVNGLPRYAHRGGPVFRALCLSHDIRKSQFTLGLGYVSSAGRLKRENSACTPWKRNQVAATDWNNHGFRTSTNAEIVLDNRLVQLLSEHKCKSNYCKNRWLSCELKSHNQLSFINHTSDWLQRNRGIEISESGKLPVNLQNDRLISKLAELVEFATESAWWSNYIRLYHHREECPASHSLQKKREK